MTSYLSQFQNPYITSSTSSRGHVTLAKILAELESQFDQWSTATSFVERDGVYSAQIEVPGYKRDEISIEASPDGYITVSAENKSRGKSSRAFYLSDPDVDRIEAKLEDGILSLSVPRHTDALPRKITVK